MLFKTSCFALCVSAVASAQSLTLPLYQASPFVSTTPPNLLVYEVEGTPRRPYAVFADVSRGPVDVLGARFEVGFSPAFFQLGAGTLDAIGTARGELPVSGGLGSGLNSVTLFSQAVILEPNAPNGLFLTSNGASSSFAPAFGAIVEDFTAPVRDGLTGNFDPSSTFRVAGSPVRVRTHRTVDPSQGVFFAQGVTSPLEPRGSRAQYIFRPQDVGANGEAEVVTAIRWRSASGAVVAEVFPTVEMSLANSTIAPNYLVDLFSALPLFPNSGLGANFAANLALGEAPTIVYSGGYNLQPSSLRANGYVDFPRPTSQFEYDGVSSLLIEFKVVAISRAVGQNGALGRIMIESSPLPGARTTTRDLVGGTIVDPFTVTTGQADNLMMDYEIEFARVRTVISSPWRQGRPGADYRAPIVVAETPAGTSIQLRFRGATSSTGANSTAWSNSVDVADGFEFVQFEVSLIADIATGAVPSIDALIIPN